MDETLFDNIDGTLWVTESIFDAPNVPNGKKTCAVPRANLNL